jgi:nucleoside-diphosphate-sugar epimerase
MRILVIGGTTFIGPSLVHRLLQHRHEVSVLHRRDRHDLGAGVHNVQANRSDLDAVSRVLGAGRYDAIFDLAYDFEKGTPAAQVEAAAAQAGGQLQRYVFMSSIAAYGPGVNHREDAPLVPDTFPNPYAQHKASSERALFRLHAERGVPVTTFRPPFVHGPRQPFYREQFFWDRLLDGRPIILPDDGETPMQWAFVSDVADACARSLDVPEAAGEAFNVGHDEPLTHRSFVEALARVAGVTPAFAPIGRDRIQAAGGHLFMGHLYFGEFLDLPPHTGAIDKARRVLGFAPTPLDVALAQSFAWYRSQPRRPVDYDFEDRLLAGS